MDFIANKQRRVLMVSSLISVSRDFLIRVINIFQRLEGLNFAVDFGFSELELDLSLLDTSFGVIEFNGQWLDGDILIERGFAIFVLIAKNG